MATKKAAVKKAVDVKKAPAKKANPFAKQAACKGGKCKK